MHFTFISTKRLQASLLGIASLFFSAAHAKAALITDPAGDFLPSYTGPHNGDLDVLSAQVLFNGSTFTFTSTVNGAIGTTPNATYIWGIDRGMGTASFPAIAPGVTFDSVFSINPSGQSSVTDLIDKMSTPITNISVNGSTVTGTVDLSALPSEGLAPSNYLVNLWPKAGTSSDMNLISDFAPNNSDVPVTSTVTSATPEPAGLTLAGGILLVGLALIRRRRNASAELPGRRLS